MDASITETEQSQSQSQQKQPRRGEPHQRLEAFLGQWRIEGKNLDGADEFAGSDVEGGARFEWLPGEFFLMQREEVRFDGGSHETTWVFAWDEAQQRYTAHFFDSLGYTRSYDVTVEGSTWTFEGPEERGSLVFDDNMETYRGFWERSLDGRWIPLCEFTATRLH